MGGIRRWSPAEELATWIEFVPREDENPCPHFDGGPRASPARWIALAIARTVGCGCRRGRNDKWPNKNVSAAHRIGGSTLTS